MVLAVFTRCLVPEIQIFGHFWLKSAFLGQNFSRTDIFTAKPMVVGCVQHYSAHFVKKQENCQSCFFVKSKKMQTNAKNGKKLQKNADLSKISNFQEKSVSVTFHPLLVPNFMPNFGKIIRAVSEIIRSARADGRTRVIL